MRQQVWNKESPTYNKRASLKLARSWPKGKGKLRRASVAQIFTHPHTHTSWLFDMMPISESHTVCIQFGAGFRPTHKVSKLNPGLSQLTEDISGTVRNAPSRPHPSCPCDSPIFAPRGLLEGSSVRPGRLERRCIEKTQFTSGIAFAVLSWLSYQGMSLSMKLV